MSLGQICSIANVTDCGLPSIAGHSGIFSYTSTGIGAKALAICQDGYATRNGKSTMTCQAPTAQRARAAWSPVFCDPISKRTKDYLLTVDLCNPPTAPLNGYIAIAPNSNEIGAFGYAVCHTGYTTKTHKITCQRPDDSPVKPTWTPVHCTIIPTHPTDLPRDVPDNQTCLTPPTVANGKVHMLPKIEGAANAVLVCASGYYPNDDTALIRCVRGKSPGSGYAWPHVQCQPLEENDNSTDIALGSTDPGDDSRFPLTSIGFIVGMTCLGVVVVASCGLAILLRRRGVPLSIYLRSAKNLVSNPRGHATTRSENRRPSATNLVLRRDSSFIQECNIPIVEACEGYQSTQLELIRSRIQVESDEVSTDVPVSTTNSVNEHDNN
eukprot:scpid69096/ scgid5483/ 